jgi:hypothetical protein
MSAESYTRQPIDTEQHWSPDIQQPQSILTTMRNIQGRREVGGGPGQIFFRGP